MGGGKPEQPARVGAARYVTERLEAHGFVMESPTSPLEEDMPPLESADAEIEARLEGLPSSLRSAPSLLTLCAIIASFLLVALISEPSEPSPRGDVSS